MFLKCCFILLNYTNRCQLIVFLNFLTKKPKLFLSLKKLIKINQLPTMPSVGFSCFGKLEKKKNEFKIKERLYFLFRIKSKIQNKVV